MHLQICVLTISMISNSAGATHTIVDQIMATQVVQVSHLKSIDYTVVETFTPKDRADIPLSPWKMVSNQKFQGEMFRIELGLDGTEGNVGEPRTRAFNGSRIQTFTPSALTLVVKDGASAEYQCKPAILLPYEFLFCHPDEIWFSAVSDVSRWDAVFARSVKVENAMAVGHDCVKVTFSDSPALFPKTKAKYLRRSVYFSRRLGYYPVQIDWFYSSGQIQVSTKVVDFMMSPGAEEIIVPCKIVQEAYSEKQELIWTQQWEIDKISTNKVIDSSVFTLSESGVQVFANLSAPAESYSLIQQKDKVEKDVLESIEGLAPAARDLNLVEEKNIIPKPPKLKQSLQENMGSAEQKGYQDKFIMAGKISVPLVFILYGIFWYVYKRKCI